MEVGVIARIHSYALVVVAASVLLSQGCESCGGDGLNDIPVVAPITDGFTQTASAAKLDLLFVVDNSVSMAPAQDRISESMGTFFDWIRRAGVEFRIAVTSSDAVGVLGSAPAARGQFAALGGEGVVTPQTPNAVGVLQRNIRLGADGSNNEMPIYTAMLALGMVKAQRGTPPPGNAGFVRPDARLGVIFISDEDDHSDVTTGEFLQVLKDEKGAGNLDSVFLGGVLHDGVDVESSYVAAHRERLPPRSCGEPTGDQEVSSGLLDMLMNAPYPSTIISICGDFSAGLQRLAIQAAGFTTRFRLSQTADQDLRVPCPDDENPSVFCVRVNGDVVGSNRYSFDAAANQIVFEGSYVPPLGATITVDYAVLTLTDRQEDEGEQFSPCASDAECPVGVTCGAGRCDLNCDSGDDCIPGYACGAAGSCRCEQDSSCASGEFCSPNGSCQKKLACTNNAECAAGETCGLSDGKCLAAGSCRTPQGVGRYWTNHLGALQCKALEICADGACRTGCWDNAGCAGGRSCTAVVNQDWGACSAGCVLNSDCCLNQRCDLATRSCINAGGVAQLPLCDLPSCQNGTCVAAGGGCVRIFEGSFGCVPSCETDLSCGKGTVCRKLLVAFEGNGCTHGGNECGNGKTCLATAESPVSICSCLSNADCSSDSECVAFGEQSYCRARRGLCAAELECEVLVSGVQPLLCNDVF